VKDLLVAQLDKTLSEIRETQHMLLEIVDEMSDYAFTQAMNAKKDKTLTYKERLAKAQTWEYIGDQFLDVRNGMGGNP
jgi:uncharacterized protein YciW